MLTREEQGRVFDEAMGLVRYHARIRHQLAIGMTHPRRGRELWQRRVDEFKDLLKEIGDVPMSALPVEASNLAKPDPAQEEDRAPRL